MNKVCIFILLFIDLPFQLARKNLNKYKNLTPEENHNSEKKIKPHIYVRPFDFCILERDV